jgi:hypothetical protein
MLSWYFLGNRPEVKWWLAWNEALEKVSDPRVKKDLQTFHLRAMHLVAERLVFGSPALIMVMILIVCRDGLRSVGDALGKSLSKFIDPKVLEEEAAKAAA